MNFLQDLVITFGAPVEVALMTIALANLFHMPPLYTLITIAAPTGAISILVMIRFRRRVSGSSGQASKGPKIAISVKPSAPVGTASKSPNPGKGGAQVPGKMSAKPPAPVSAPVPVASPAKVEVKPEQLGETREIRDLLAKMQNQMELISEILLSSPEEKNEIRESSSALKKFKLASAGEDKAQSSESTPSATESADTKADPKKEIHLPSDKTKQDEQPFVNKKGKFEELPRPIDGPAPKLSPRIKIPVSALQEGAEEVPVQREVQTVAPSTEGKGVTELVQLRKELERIRERISSGS